MLTLEQQAAFVEEAPAIFLPIPGGWGKMGHTHIRLAAASEDALAGALRTAWKLRVDKNAKTSQKNPRCGGEPRSNRQETREAATMRTPTAQNRNSSKKDLSPQQREELLGALEARFERNINRHKGLEWAQIQAKLEAPLAVGYVSLKNSSAAISHPFRGRTIHVLRNGASPDPTYSCRSACMGSTCAARRAGM